MGAAGTMSAERLVIGSRGSVLALVQADWVAARLGEAHPGLEVAVEKIATTGDRILDAPLSKIGDKGLFTKELETALSDGRIDLAVHSAKDVQTAVPAGLVIAAFTRRDEVRDVFVAAPVERGTREDGQAARRPPDGCRAHARSS